jgi:hypothetical protein
MAFVTDGSVHYSGVKNELDTLRVMQALGLVSENAEQKGGTKSKADLVDGGRNFSVKHKDLLSKGSFDWVNTTRIDYLKGEHFDDFLSEVREIVESGRTISEATIEGARLSFQEATFAALKNCSEKELTAFLREHFEAPNKGMQCVITESSTKKLFMFNFEQHPAIALLNQGWEPFFDSCAGSSAKIYFRKGSESVDTGLRLRLTSNNGIQAFFGLKRDRNGRKKQSVVVAKLQQDAVHRLIEAVPCEVYSY